MIKILISLILVSFSIQAYALSCASFKTDLSKVKTRNSCKGKNVHLTFDDGPHLKMTPKIVDSLKRQGVKATFFVSTHQLENKSGSDLAAKKKLMKQMLKSGHNLASHGHDHNAHDIRYTGSGKRLSQGYDDKGREEQVAKSIRLLNKYTDNGFSRQRHKLIRFPYGRGISPSQFELDQMRREGRYIKDGSPRDRLNHYRMNSPAMQVASNHGLSHLGWSHDSKDSTSLGVPAKKNAYIDSALESLCGGGKRTKIALFHDTRKVNSTPSKYSTKKNPITVMDEMIAKAKCMGVKFVTLDQLLKKKLSLGEYTPKYKPTRQVRDVASILNSPKSLDPIGDLIKSLKSCKQPMTKGSSKGKSCYSKYAGKSYSHCDGASSFCIDGTWIQNEGVKNLVCENKIDSVKGIQLAKKVIGKSCRKGAKSKYNVPGAVSCFCQFKNGTKDLVWKCYDTSKPSKPLIK